MTIAFPEFADNQENRCPVALVLDTSGSMQGAPIQALNQGIETFKQDVLRDVQATLSLETAIVAFGKDGARKIQDFVGIDGFQPPALAADGLTPMGEAVNLALDLLEARKAAYKSNGVYYYRPWLILITDGAPTDDWRGAAQRLQQAEKDNRVIALAVAVQGANAEVLRQFSQRPPVALNGLDFRDLFLWLSNSMKRVSAGKVGEAVALPPMNWGQIVS
ncbi:MAG: VWA domain-containing protein [Cyanobacteria bacterium RI_101]|nr:VWA domain-containing protein [Cyanobacteria bacterium RI_101]